MVALVRSSLSRFPAVVRINAMSVPFSGPLIISSVTVCVSSEDRYDESVPAVVTVIVLACTPMLRLNAATSMIK